MFSNAIRLWMLLVVTFVAFGHASLTQAQPQKKEYSPEEKAKLKQAEAFADKFVQRWHETLDFNVLFDEMFVADESLRRKMVEHSFGFFIDDWNDGIDARFHEYAVKIIGNDRARSASIAFLNLALLSLELKLFYPEQELNRSDSIIADEQLDKLSKTISAWFQKQKKLDPKFTGKVPEEEVERIRQLVNQFIESLNHQNAVYRTKLSRELFNTKKYKNNLELEHGEGASEIVSGEDSLYEELKLKNRERLYEVERGIFRLLITEEAGQFKVLFFK